MIWAVLRLRKAEEPIREYIYKKSVQALPHRAMLCMIFAGLGFVTMVLYLACLLYTSPSPRDTR